MNTYLELLPCERNSHREFITLDKPRITILDLPSDIIKEICTYLTDIDIKHVLKVRNYIDTNLMIRYIEEDNGIRCRMCNMHDRYHKMKFIQDKFYCKCCYDKLIFCHTYSCGKIIEKYEDRLRKCVSCGNAYCHDHRYWINTCCVCQKQYCHLHIDTYSYSGTCRTVSYAPNGKKLCEACHHDLKIKR